MRGTLFRIPPVALAVSLVGGSFVLPRIPMPWRMLLQLGAGGLLPVAARAPLGLRPPRLWRGLRVGLPVAAVATAAVAATTAVPLARSVLAARELPGSAIHWLAVQIPLGTVWAEEIAFRAALGRLAADAFGPAAGRVVQAAAFGMSHIADARGTGAPVAPTVLVTGVAGWLFGWLAERDGSVAAPMLLHLALDEAGAVAALTVQRRTGR
ncbi:abortive phage infection protein [Mycobacterium talmoniae]|uniref:Abortive phage infection protein n=1 Tax=Mycobacterium talmoniae TaxID=1858794 RepID=A0A1S1NI13_9MYCO|nr:abortive phage infection protein [Mycobacterium talmoniae]